MAKKRVRFVQEQSGWSNAVPAVTVYKVPRKYRLVIEHVSVSGSTDLVDATLATQVGGRLANHCLSVQPQASPGSPGVVSELTRLYADAETDVSFLGHMGAGGTGLVAISGQLVPVK
jgi:hypothetical protein